MKYDDKMISCGNFGKIYSINIEILNMKKRGMLLKSMKRWLWWRVFKRFFIYSMNYVNWIWRRRDVLLMRWDFEYWDMIVRIFLNSFDH